MGWPAWAPKKGEGEGKGWVWYMSDAKVIENGFSLKSFFAAAVVLPCRIDC